MSFYTPSAEVLEAQRDLERERYLASDLYEWAKARPRNVLKVTADPDTALPVVAFLLARGESFQLARKWSA